jgi:hypothetical protein
MKVMEERERYVGEKEVSYITGRAIQTLRNDRHLGRGIPYSKYGRLVRYLLGDVYSHMEARKIMPKAA